ncbi:MAG: hypothetical protein RBJ76_13150 [Stenomitos frigidus ULC029]
MAGSYQQQTTSGYDLYEVISAFQKAIRRGEEYNALYWASEIDKSNFSGFLWNRIKIIAVEDIGLAAPGLVADINALFEWWTQWKKDKKESEGIFIVQAVCLLARAPKSRMTDHAVCLFWQDRATLPRLEIPDEALDKHTRRGKSMKRGFDHFVEEASKLNNEAVGVANPYYDLYLVGRRNHYNLDGNGKVAATDPGQANLFDDPNW